MTPHLGQGACQAIEDADVLAQRHRTRQGTGPGTGPGPVPDLAAYTAARLRRTRMVAEGSYRATRMTGLTSRPATALRNTGISLAGRLGPRVMLRQLAPVASWTPPPLTLAP